MVPCVYLQIYYSHSLRMENSSTLETVDHTSVRQTGSRWCQYRTCSGTPATRARRLIHVLTHCVRVLRKIHWRHNNAFIFWISIMCLTLGRRLLVLKMSVMSDEYNVSFFKVLPYHKIFKGVKISIMLK